VPQNAVEAILKSTVADRKESDGSSGSAHTG
jgi:hypothetical protein